MKNNLLDECNDQKVPPKDFLDIFCKRCRNPDCTNAGWAVSTFEDRVRTQVDRLLVNPVRARPEDTRFDPLRAMHFLEISAEVARVRQQDPWAGPGVHLAEPDVSETTNQAVEEAVARLASVKVPGEPQTEPPEETRTAVAPVESQKETRSAINTEFPDAGVMIGGAPIPDRVQPKLIVDPWAPSPKVTVVPRGTKIRMDK